MKSSHRSAYLRLPPKFFLQPTLDLAGGLLGKVLVADHGAGDLRAGRIVETEAYCGPEDLCAHTARGRLSARNRAMHGPPGYAYIYRIYGIHLCFNVVTGPRDVPHAVLIRALEPLTGLESMARSLGQPERKPETLCRGPGLLCRALGITMDHYGCDLRKPGPLYLAQSREEVKEPGVGRSVRIGVTGGAPWPAMPWRFFWLNHPSVSGPAKLRQS